MNISPNGIIEVYRGDTFILPLSLNLGNPIQKDIFEMQEGDRAVLRIFRANDFWENYLVSKTATLSDVKENEFVQYSFASSDTLFLESGIYFYEVKLFYTRDNVENVTTLFPRKRFIILN